MIIYLVSDTILFEQISFNITRSQFTSDTKMNSNEFTKSRRIIISGGLCISKSFHSRIGCDDLIFKSATALKLRFFSSTMRSTNSREILNNTLGIDGLTSTRFTWKANLTRFQVQILKSNLFGMKEDLQQLKASTLLCLYKKFFSQWKPLCRLKSRISKNWNWFSLLWELMSKNRLGRRAAQTQN